MVVSMNNEPAFPAMHYDLADNEHGMTLRDYFAAKAMLGYMNDCYDLDPTERATAAYKQADEMLKAREAWTTAQHPHAQKTCSSLNAQ